MSKNLWITLAIVLVIVVALALVLMMILIPPSAPIVTGISYDSIVKTDFTYTDTKYDPQKEENWEMHEIENADITSGINSGIYDPGNTNPFTPKGDLNIYNEPGYVDENGNTLGGSSGSTTGGSLGYEGTQK
ncbi:MAG: hypothetical protein IKV94_04170 [Clostridia bacterium]|nr:hypothetical protein [Clostridia bacterium]